MKNVMSISVEMVCADVIREGDDFVMRSTTHNIEERFPANVSEEMLRIACTMFLEGYSKGLAATENE